jgi:diguanylate cyclase (GGDEF)-like protein
METDVNATPKRETLPQSTAPPTLPLDARLASIRRDFVEKLWSAMFVLAIVAVPISVARAANTGWLGVYTVHMGLGAAVALVWIGRRKISELWLSGLLVGLFWCAGFPGVMSFGIGATGFYWLALSCLMAHVLLPRRTALAVTAGVGASLIVIGWSFVSGQTQPTIDLATYQRLPAAWAMMIIVTGIFLFFIYGAFKSKDDAVLRLLIEVEAQRKVIERSATHDTLTDLPNLRLAEDRTALAIQQARRRGTKMALLFLDLDGLKSVNDTYGHADGDAVLRLAAGRIASRLRATDTVARIGGDEFLILLPDMVDAASAGHVAASLIEALGAPCAVNGKALSIGASIGIAVFPEHGMTGAELRRNADGAMYEAKRRGKGHYRYAQQDERSARGDGDGLPPTSRHHRTVFGRTES